MVKAYISVGEKPWTRRTFTSLCLNVRGNMAEWWSECPASLIYLHFGAKIVKI